jgi:type I restriction enzyme M protein
VAVVLQKKPGAALPHPVFFADSKWCGHDSRGRSVPLNDVPCIAANFAEFRRSGRARHGSLGIAVDRDRLGLNLAPRAFEFDAETESERIAATHEILTVGSLVKEGVVSLATGDEVGKLTYGTGDIPFVRTSDISNWEVKLDTKHCVSREVYERFESRQDVRPNDILMVRDGTYLIGTCAIITRYDLPMLYQSHIYKIRVEDTSRINPFLLLAALTCNFAQRQIKSFCISQDIIDSLGDKIHQVYLALPKSKEARIRITNLVEKVIHERIEARELARKACEEIMAQ